MLCLPPVRALPEADGAAAADALQRRGAGLCAQLPPAGGGSVQPAGGAAAADRPEGRGLQHRRRYVAGSGPRRLCSGSGWLSRRLMREEADRLTLEQPGLCKNPNLVFQVAQDVELELE